jgi:hypothetical protein
MLPTFQNAIGAATRSAIVLQIKARWNAGTVDQMDARSVLIFIVLSIFGLLSIMTMPPPPCEGHLKGI